MGTSLLQILMGTIGALGFAMLFGLTEKRILAWIAVGAAVGWGIYLAAVANGSGIYAGLLISSLFVGAYSERMARVLRVPAIAIMVPSLVPAIPGGDLYYTMASLVNEDLTVFRLRALRVLLEAGSIALGIALVAFAEIIFRTAYSHIKTRKPSN